MWKWIGGMEWQWRLRKRRRVGMKINHTNINYNNINYNYTNNILLG